MHTRPLIVLDLNGTLCLSQHRPYPGHRADARARTKYVYRRPRLSEFLRFLFEHFRVAVWSSNSAQNAEATVDVLFDPAQRSALEFVWGRDMCVAKNYGDYSSHKPLKRILNREGSLVNVTMIDDTPEKIVDVQMPRNYYAIKPYERPDPRDVGLWEAEQWLRRFYLSANQRV